MVYVDKVEAKEIKERMGVTITNSLLMPPPFLKASFLMSQVQTVFIGSGALLDLKSGLFESEDDEFSRLTFALIDQIGYVYLRGKGKVLSKDGKEIKLGY